MNTENKWSRASITLITSAAAAAACIPRLNNGISTLDDGFYAYAAAAVLDGKIIHRDFFSQYLGYQHYLHAALFYIFGEDYFTLRYLLIITQFVSGLSAALIFRKKGWGFQICAILITTGFGILLFKNPSTSWTCVALSLSIAATLTLSHQRPLSLPHLIALGALLGVMLGIRHPTAIFVGMGVFVYQVISTKKEYLAKKNGPFSTLTIYIGLTLTLVALLTYMLKASSIIDLLPWFIAPISYLCYALVKVKNSDSALILKKLIWIAVGLLLTISPWVIFTTTTGTWKEALLDLGTMPVNYSSSLDLTTAGYAGSIIFTLKHPPDLLAIVGTPISALALLFPTLVALAIWKSPTNEKIKVWIESPITIIASFHVLVIIAIIVTVYSSYIISLEILSLLYLTYLIRDGAKKIFFVTLISSISIVTFFWLSPQYEQISGASYFGSARWKLSPCWLPRCSLMTTARNNNIAREAYNAIEKVKTQKSTVNALPWGYHYEFSYPSAHQPKYPDTRLPLYRGVDPRTAYGEIVNQEDPIILIEKFSARDESVYPEFQDYFVRDFVKIYDSPAFMVLVKKERYKIK